MFIHWGIYSLPVRNENMMMAERTSRERYKLYADMFNPDLYDPVEWAATAKATGMKYVVFTTKHLDGFCMWDTKYTDFKITNTPYGKDVLKPLVDAFRAEGIRIGFYYSMIDWNHPDYTYDHMHPNRPDSEEGRAEANKNRDMKKYQQYMKNQLTEFGQIDELFLDYSYPSKGHNEWDSEGMLKLIRQLQPQILVDNRADLNHTSWGWDFLTPEMFVPHEWPTVNGERVPWEICQNFDGWSFGYARDQHHWKSTRQLIVMLAETVSKGGNLLMNVGPTGRGTFEDRAIERFKGIGEWMKVHSRAIYGCTQAPDGFQTPKNCLLTYNPETHRMYIHVLEWPFKSLHLPGFEGKVKYAQLLNDASELGWYTQTYADPGAHTHETSKAGDLIMPVPTLKPNVALPVIELILE
ncbi:MAG: alpha-L-fucosidase [Prevotella sp.]|nr:alpha-L-fucosidase [Prevotella sp.]